ncbi:MAG: CAP domain-containing protein [Thiotrichaceae bacterium]
MFIKIAYKIVLANSVLWISACTYTPANPPTKTQNQPTVPVANVPQNKPAKTRTPVVNTSTRKPTQSRQSVRVNPQQIVTSHNRVRARYRLPPLSWSPSLARFSTQWANHLLKTKGCHMQHRPHSGRFKTDFGENLFWASPYRWSDGRSDIQNISSANVVHEWAKEVSFYNYKSNRCQPGQQCGHYTQMVWRDSRKVGCGLAVCADKSQVWVCSYDPPGNWQGKRPY